MQNLLSPPACHLRFSSAACVAHGASVNMLSSPHMRLGHWPPDKSGAVAAAHLYNPLLTVTVSIPICPKCMPMLAATSISEYKQTKYRKTPWAYGRHGTM